MQTLKENREKFGQWIVEARQAKGLTQIELGELVGLEKNSILRIEKGRQNPKVVNVIKLAESVDKDPEEGLRILFGMAYSAANGSSFHTDISDQAADQLADIVRESARLNPEGRATVLRLIKALKPENQIGKDFELVDSDKAKPSEKDRPEEYEDLN